LTAYQHTTADPGQIIFEPFQAICEGAIGQNKNGIGIREQVNPTTILISEPSASFSDVKGTLDDFLLGSTLRHQARFRYRTP
jgi:hypothetical protein